MLRYFTNALITLVDFFWNLVNGGVVKTIRAVSGNCAWFNVLQHNSVATATQKMGRICKNYERSHSRKAHGHPPKYQKPTHSLTMPPSASTIPPLPPSRHTSALFSSHTSVTTLLSSITPSDINATTPLSSTTPSDISVTTPLSSTTPSDISATTPLSSTTPNHTSATTSLSQNHLRVATPLSSSHMSVTTSLPSNASTTPILLSSHTGVTVPSMHATSPVLPLSATLQPVPPNVTLPHSPSPKAAMLPSCVKEPCALQQFVSINLPSEWNYHQSNTKLHFYRITDVGHYG